MSSPTTSHTTQAAGEVFLFDLYGVLLKVQTPQALRRIEAALGAQEGDEQIWQLYWELRQDFDAGRLSATEYWELFAQRSGLNFDIDAVIRVDYDSWLDQDDEMVEFVTGLINDGRRVALLSNIPEGLKNEVVAKFGWLQQFETLIFSCDIDAAKPEHKAYAVACERLGVEPAQVRFFDDNAGNVAAANEFGLNATVFTGIETVRQVLG